MTGREPNRPGDGAGTNGVTGVVPMGEHALLARCADLAAVHRLHAELRRRAPAWLVEAVPAWDTVLLVAAPGAAGELDALGRELAGWRLPPPDAPDAAAAPAAVEIPVVYDGPDLADVARLTGLDEAEVVARHCAPTYTVAFLGFTPGFPYLVGLDPALRVPRLDSPRTRVPAGSVGIGGEQTGVYPQATPGGWRLLGRTGAVLFDAGRTPPALLEPGSPVRFVPVPG